MSFNKVAWWEAVLLVAGLLLFAGQAALSSPRKSAAFDEEYHVAAGYAYLKTGDFRLSLSHPPLINALSALPLLFRDDVNLPLDHPSWAEGDYFNFADVFLWQAQSDPQSILEWARWPVIGLGVILAAALFWWARQMGGVWAGWIALLLALFDPNLLANSRLVTTDLGLTVFLFLTIWRLWHWLETPSRKNLVLTGTLAGLTMAAKFTGLLIWPMIGLIVMIWRWKRDNFLSLIVNLLVMFFISFLALWAVYRFDVSPYPGTNLPLPASFYPYSLWDTFMGIEQQPKTAFLLGQTSPRGWWYYFPVALAVKTSLPLLVLAGWGAAVFLRRKGWRYAAVLWLPPLLFLALAMTGRITIGYRHILPVVPFLIMLAAQAGRSNWVTGKSRPMTNYPITQLPNYPVTQLLIITALLLWHAAGTLRLFPHQEAFFNELAGGPAGGGRILVDSNIDWGQDLILLRELLAERGIDWVYLGYFGTAVPEAYHVPYKPIPGFLRQTAGPEINAYNPYTPPPGWYAISQTSLQLGLLEQNVEMYAFFREMEPVARAGYSINLYKVTYPDDVPVDRTVVMGTAVSDLTPDELGVQDGRRLIVKWAANEETQISPAEEDVTLPDNFQPVNANFAGMFTLLGYAVADGVVRPGEPVALTLVWRRETAEIPAPAPAKAGPLAAFVHLSGADPAQIVTQYDGWDTAVTGLEAGDLITQRITLWLPPGVEPGEWFLRAGLYSPQTGQRFPLAGGPADFVTLGSLVVEKSGE